MSTYAGSDVGVVGHDAVAGEQRDVGHAQHQLAAPEVPSRRKAPPDVVIGSTRR
jgi:hypothetical protein